MRDAFTACRGGRVCQEETRKLQVWSNIRNCSEKKIKRENRKSRFRFQQNILKERNSHLQYWAKFGPQPHFYSYFSLAE